jgi:hypothetical protein
MTLSLLLSVLLTVACAPAGGDEIQTQSSTATVQSFTSVEGADLMTKLEAAQARGRTRQTPYWSAYTFDVRPGVAIDPAVGEFHGNMTQIGDTTVFVGTTPDGLPVETRSLAVFLLREPSANQITRLEIYNLERKREYSGYPVYWLGRANNEESLNYLRAIAAASPLDTLSERAVIGIAVHDDARVGGITGWGKLVARWRFSRRLCGTKVKTRNSGAALPTRLARVTIAARSQRSRVSTKKSKTRKFDAV